LLTVFQAAERPRSAEPAADAASTPASVGTVAITSRVIDAARRARKHYSRNGNPREWT
jgi:hypothetical protein